MLIFLLPPSESKQQGGRIEKVKRQFPFLLPTTIAQQASPKDLKCSKKRYEEGIHFNKHIDGSPTLPAISRYSGVMYHALTYTTMSHQAQSYFNKHTLICSGMYGLLHPQDRIGNYKLPIETKGLYSYRQEQHITDVLIEYLQKKQATLIDLLPNSYKKMFDRKRIDKAQIAYKQVHFYQKSPEGLKKFTHGVKKVKGQRLQQQCFHMPASLHDLGGIHLEDEMQMVL